MRRPVPGLPLGLVFRLLIHRVTRLTGRADGGIVGAQASGDARALRHKVIVHLLIGMDFALEELLLGL